MGDERSQTRNSCRCRRPGPRAASGHMTSLIPLLLLLTTITQSTLAMCPMRCQCNDDVLQATCSGAGLQVVPIQLNPELRHINLSHNKINSLHFTLEIYANLISLDVSSNRVQKLGSMNFVSQVHLVSLNLSHNEIESLDKDVFKGLRSLKELDLNSNNIEEISVNAFKELGLLEVLLLNENKIVSFEENLFKHQSQLRVLELDDNQLLEIPADNLVYMPKLERISMSRNLVEFVEDTSLPTLKSLYHLSLDSNVISEIHDSAFDGCTALKSLNLADNHFTIVPTTQLSKLSNLLDLSLSGNFFSTIPPVAFRGLFKLRRLHLDGMENLTRIDLRAFVDNINLELVSLNDNIGLNSIPTRLFHGNPMIRYISIRNNMLRSLEATHFPLDQLVTLQIGDNPLYCNCSLMWLWKLVTEQRNTMRMNQQSSVNDTMEESPAPDLSLDIDHIRCDGPEALSGVLLVEAPESDIRCSPNWLAVATGCATATCVLVVVFIALAYSGTLSRCSRRRNAKSYRRDPSHEGATYQSEATTSDRQRNRDKCEHMISPPLLSEYQSLPTWEAYTGSKDPDLYRQFGYHMNTPHPPRPHVVYV